jgi:hypothetical protein
MAFNNLPAYRRRSMSCGIQRKNYLHSLITPLPGTLRISADDEKESFLIGREGFLRRRTVLRNEYGIRIGQLTYDNNQDNQGMIDVYEEISLIYFKVIPPEGFDLQKRRNACRN